MLDHDKLTLPLFLRLFLPESDYLAIDRNGPLDLADVVAVTPQAIPLNDSLRDHVHLNRGREYFVRVLWNGPVWRL